MIRQLVTIEANGDGLNYVTGLDMPGHLHMYDRGEVACHFCFDDKVLRDWIKEESIGRAKCPWCGRRGHLIYLTKLAEPFREVVSSLYSQADGYDAADHAASI